MVGDGCLRWLVARCLHADRDGGRHAVHAEDATAIEEAYFPWIGSLHLLLDSLVDQQEDRLLGSPACSPTTPRRRRRPLAWG